MHPAPSPARAGELLERADLGGIRSAVAAQRSSLEHLINNAAVMAPGRQVMADGLHLQCRQCLQRPARDGAINLDDSQAERGYRPMVVYSLSKVANLCSLSSFSRAVRRPDEV